MADKVQINPQIPASTRDLLMQACQRRGQAQGVVIDAALLAYLVPSAEESTVTRLATELAQLGAIVREVQANVARLLAVIEGLAAPVPPGPPTSPAPIATYAQMYGPIVATPVPSEPVVPEVPPPGRLWRWFSKEETA